MTREEEIMQAALDYANNQKDIPLNSEFNRTLCIALGQAFRDGAQWADGSLPKWKHVCSFQSFTDDAVFIECGCLRWGDNVIALNDLKKLPKGEEI